MPECACGAYIPPREPGTGGRQRMWCSDRCRKVQYGKDCRNCGKRTDGSNGKSGAPDLCAKCFNAEVHETSVAWLVAEMRYWRELFGQQPASQEWNRGLLHWQVRAYAEGRHNGRCADATIGEVERRHAEHGPWPTTNTVQKVFGSWSRAIEAAGFAPLRSGQRREKVAA